GRKQKQIVAVFDFISLRKNLKLKPREMFVYALESKPQQSRLVGSFDRGRIGPPKHLRVQFFRKLVAERVKASDLIALRDHDVDRQSHAQDSLGLPEFSVETGRFLLQLKLPVVLIAADEIRGGNCQDDAVERTLRAVFLQQPHDRIPAAVVGGLVAAQHEVAGHIDHYAFVEEVPVQLSRPALNSVVD